MKFVGSSGKNTDTLGFVIENVNVDSVRRIHFVVVVVFDLKLEDTSCLAFRQAVSASF